MINNTSYRNSGDFTRKLIKASRPHHWEIMLVPVIIAVLYPANSIDMVLTSTTLWFFFYFSVPANLYVWGINDIFDADDDVYNQRKDEDSLELLFSGDTSIAVAIVGAGLLIGTGALFVTSPIALQVLVLCAVVPLLYSAPPLRLKRIPFIDSLVNGTFILPAVAAYVAVDGSLPPLPAIAGFWLWFSGLHALAAIIDIESDRQAGTSTIATYLGERNTLVYCSCLWTVTCILFAQIHILGGIIFLIFPLIGVYTIFSDAGPSVILSNMLLINLAVYVPILIGGIWTIIS
ncbi:prenyltransferase [Halomontanus rarus]|uniref:prenyltransferase n=1 Tax=Halomontanus rarus TaxID=3034020 RepID=UPI0023E8278D|nr:prenyltransferase [Halovivax sp. TS33]